MRNIIFNGHKWKWGKFGITNGVMCMAWSFYLPKKSSSSGAEISGFENRSVGLVLLFPMIAGGRSKLNAGFRDFKKTSKQDCWSGPSVGDVATYMGVG